MAASIWRRACFDEVRSPHAVGQCLAAQFVFKRGGLFVPHAGQSAGEGFEGFVWYRIWGGFDLLELAEDRVVVHAGCAESLGGPLRPSAFDQILPVNIFPVLVAS